MSDDRPAARTLAQRTIDTRARLGGGIQAWREVNELAGRLVMRDGAWLDRGADGSAHD